MESLWQDLRFSFRTLRAAPSFTVVAILTLALGIGANGAMFSVVSEVLLRPAPLVKEPHRLLALGRGQDGRGFEGFSHAAYLEYRDQNQVFSGLMAYRDTPLNLSSGGANERVHGTLVSGNYFSGLGVVPALGRVFLAEEDQSPGAHPVAVISYGLWQRHFGSDRSLVGKTLTLNGHSFTVVGIMPEGFNGIDLGESTEIWIPLAMEAQARPRLPSAPNDRMFSVLTVVGRLKPGLSPREAQAEMNVLARQLEEPDAQTHKQKQVVVSSDIRLPDPEWRALAREFLGILMTLVALILLSACANVANLLLARAIARRREIAVRLAVGARRTRLIRQFLTESVLISLLGGGVGVGVAFWMMDLLQLLDFLDPGLNFRLDLGVVGFMLLLSLFSGIVFGLAPALQASRPDLVPALKDTGTLGSYRGSRLRSLLVIVQMASSLILMIGTGLFVKNLQNLQGINLGFETKRVLFTPLDLRLQGYSEARARTFYQQLTERVEALPGVQSVSLSNERPISELIGIRDILIEGQVPSPDGRGTPVDQSDVAPKYFDTLGINFVRGRDFDQHDQKGSAGVAMINEAMARRFWPGEDPIGKRLSLVQFMASPTPLLQVVGVVKDTKFHRLDEKVRPHLYLPLAQNFEVDEILYLRTGGDPRSLIPEVGRVVNELDQELPVFEIRTLSDWIDELNRDDRVAAKLVGVFGLLALVLAAAGLYGIISYMVSQRAREFGVRVALGASTSDVLKLVFRQGLLLTLMGVVIGLTVALALSRIIAHWLYGLSPTEPAIFATAPPLLVAVALVACYYPARKATKVDPIVVLRSE